MPFYKGDAVVAALSSVSPQAKHSQCQRLKQRNVYCRARQGEWVAHAHRTPNSLEGFSKAFKKKKKKEPPHLYLVFQQSIFKDQVRDWCPQVCDQLVHSSLDWLMVINP